MKYLFAAFLFVLMVPCFGQNIDSLKKVPMGNYPAEKRLAALSQLGALYENKGQYHEALNYFRQAFDIRDSLDIVKKSKESSIETYSRGFVGDVMAGMQGKSESEQDILKTIDNKKSLNDTLALSINYFNLGILYKGKKEYPKSLDALQNTLQYANKIKYVELESSALNELADLYERMGDYRQSVAYFKKHMALSSAVYNRRNSKNIDELQTKYEITQREDRILQQQFEISRRNYWMAGISIILVLILLLGYIYYKQTKLKQSNIAMQAIIYTEEKERKRIAQDLHDSVSQTITAAKINLTVIGAELPFVNDEQRKRYQKAINLVNDGFKEVRTISHNMMPWALHETGLAMVIKQFVENIETDAISINFFSQGIDEPFNDNVETILYRVLQECVNNVMRHAQATRLDISIIKEAENISMTIEDNGKGFNTADPDKYRGMGLNNMQNRIGYLKGKIELDSHEGRGTLVSVYVPLKSSV
ncbi:MAG: tetratricopeptide repeat protein [Mucilaginibacter sp.]